jgi:transposase
LVIDRFHVQQLAFDAVQELRIHYRWEALEAESKAIEFCRMNKVPYEPALLSNGDSEKQLLARSRHLLFKSEARWTDSQAHRARLLFDRYPVLRKAYDLARGLGDIYNTGKSKLQVFKKLALWFNAVEDSKIESFNRVSRSVHNHHIEILNFFENRSTNAAAESFNAKVKALRSIFRGVRETEFFLYRLTKLYA